MSIQSTFTLSISAENAIEELGKDNSVVDAIEQMDSIFAFFADVGAYLTLEAHSLTAHMENKELIRSWTEFCPPKIDDECWLPRVCTATAAGQRYDVIAPHFRLDICLLKISLIFKISLMILRFCLHVIP